MGGRGKGGRDGWVWEGREGWAGEGVEYADGEGREGEEEGILEAGEGRVGKHS